MQDGVPLTISHLAAFSSRRDAYALLRKKISENMSILYDDMTISEEQKDGNEDKTNEKSILAYNSRYRKKESVIRMPDFKKTSLGSPQIENDALLLFIDSSQKEDYMKKLLDKLQSVQVGFESCCSSFGLIDSSAEIPEYDTHKASGCTESTRSSNQIVEYVAQYHCKGKVIITEALRLARVMQRKLEKESNASPYASKIRQAVTTRWVSYNNEFRTIEDKFQETVKHVLNVSDELSENIHHVNFVQPHARMQVCKDTQSEWELLYDSCRHINKEVDSLSQDLNDLYASYQELNGIVLSQDTILDNIQHNIESGQDAINHGIKDIEYSTKNMSLCNMV